MESGSLESVSSSLDVMEELEINHHHHQFPSISKPYNKNNNSPSTTSVHELLECPVCTNYMYPPIHQVSSSSFSSSVWVFFYIFVIIINDCLLVL